MTYNIFRYSELCYTFCPWPLSFFWPILKYSFCLIKIVITGQVTSAYHNYSQESCIFLYYLDLLIYFIILLGLAPFFLINLLQYRMLRKTFIEFGIFINSWVSSVKPYLLLHTSVIYFQLRITFALFSNRIYL